MDETPEIAGDIAAAGSRIRELQTGMEAQVPAQGLSLDGRSFTFTAPVSMLLPVGGYVTLRHPAVPRWARSASSRSSSWTGRKCHSPGRNGVSRASTQVRFRRIAGAGALLDAAAPFYDAELAAAEPGAVGAWLDADRPPAARLALGDLTLRPSVPVELDATGFSRHTFLCGQSGSGSLDTTGLLLEQLLLETDLPVVVLDPNSDATRLREPLPGADPATAARWQEIAGQIAVRRVGGEGDERLRLRFFDLEPAVQQAVVGLDPIADREEYDDLRTLLEADAAGSNLDEIAARLLDVNDPDVRQLALRIINLGLLDYSVWSRDRGDHGLLQELDQLESRCLVVDLGSVPSRPERQLVAAAVLARLWARRGERKPVLLVIDEAHNVCPPEAHDQLTAVATERAIDIAAEGRKFGLHLLAATQRPLKVHDHVPVPVRQPRPHADELRGRPRTPGGALLVRPTRAPGTGDELHPRPGARGGARRVASHVRHDRCARRAGGRGRRPHDVGPPAHELTPPPNR